MSARFDWVTHAAFVACVAAFVTVLAAFAYMPRTTVPTGAEWQPFQHSTIHIDDTKSGAGQ